MESWFEQRERALLQDEYDTLYTAPAAVFRGITVNALRGGGMPVWAAPLLGFNVRPSPFCRGALLVLDDTVKLGTHPLHHGGGYYVQEPSAAAPPDLLQVQPGDRVLDTCAAPGGKTSRLGALLHGEGLLVANEYDTKRAAVLKSNLERMVVTNAIITNEDTARLASAFPQFFNKILVDAPCSGEGMFRKEPQAVTQHGEALVTHCAELGKEILDNAAACLAPDGLLVYSTCTFASQENEQQIAAFLQRHADFELLPVQVDFGAPGEERRLADIPCANIAYTRRIYPCHGGEGQFMALLHRVGMPQAAQPRAMRTDVMPKECAEFLRRYFPQQAHLPCRVIKDTVYLLPDTFVPDTGRLRVLRAGVEAGCVVRGRFEPSHQLFMAYGEACTQHLLLPVGDMRAAAWLRGEEIDAQEPAAGWLTVLYAGVPLGGGKQTGMRVKNHYPKGLRNLK